MTTISIPVNRAHDAIIWAKDQGFKHFEVQHMIPHNKYEFRFKQPDQATLFALKWM
jgi:hypothetical protein